MPRHNLNDLLAFVTVAREGSFTRAAAKLGVTQSALSQTVSGLETRLKIRLLTRTTRSVSPTAAGERLLLAIGHRFDEIESELEALTELRDKPAGTVRITCGDQIIRTTLLPKLMPLLHEYPDIKLELDINYGFRDIVADRFDAGVRFSGTVDKDMIAVRIGPDMRMAVVASPAYFAKHPAPKTPRDLVHHQCINIRFPTYGGLDVWEFERRGRKLKIRVDGQLVVNTPPILPRLRWAAWAWPICRRMSFGPTSKKDAWCAYWKTGARPSRLSPVLPQPSAAIARVCARSRRTAYGASGEVRWSTRRSDLQRVWRLCGFQAATSDPLCEAAVPAGTPTPPTLNRDTASWSVFACTSSDCAAVATSSTSAAFCCVLTSICATAWLISSMPAVCSDDAPKSRL